jgi:hypothetical protein
MDYSLAGRQRISEGAVKQKSAQSLRVRASGGVDCSAQPIATGRESECRGEEVETEPLTNQGEVQRFIETIPESDDRSIAAAFIKDVETFHEQQPSQLRSPFDLRFLVEVFVEMIPT